jgi:UPF0755 protein
LAGKKKKKTGAFSHLIKLFTVFIALFIVIVPLLLGAVMFLNAPVQSVNMPRAAIELDGIRIEEDGVYIEVRKGESSQSVGRRLERAGLISNRYFWYLLSRFESDFIKSGTYRLEMPASQIAIHRILVSGRQILHRVTIPEGVTLSKMARILEEAGVCSADDFTAASADPEIIGRYRIPNSTMEGYLFPDTYLFPGEYPASRVVRALADTFFERLEKIAPSSVDLSPHDLNQKVIIASIVEREYRVSEEAPLMAGVFYNRLGIGMALQSCATVEYIITEIQGKPHPSVLYNRDLEIRSPYNTYLVPGLPPGPISAPGATALYAAFFPVQTEYFYFRLDDPQSGRHYFSRTLDEHIKAGQLFVKGSL